MPLSALVPCRECNTARYFSRANLPYVTMRDGVPEWNHPFDRDNLVVPGLYKKVFEYSTVISERIESGRGLLLHGPSGSGKTRMAAQIGLAAVMAGHSTRMDTLVAMLDNVKAEFSKPDGAADLVWKRYREDTELLVLDDLGAENRSSDWVPERVFDLFDYRIKHRKCLVITTKYSPEELGARIAPRDPMVGDSIVSRLKELCRFVEVKAKRDYRDIINQSEDW